MPLTSGTVIILSHLFLRFDYERFGIYFDISHVPDRRSLICLSTAMFVPPIENETIWSFCLKTAAFRLLLMRCREGFAALDASPDNSLVKVITIASCGDLVF